MLPFEADAFFGVFADYNRATWPAPLVAYAAAIAMVAAAYTGRPAWGNRAIAAAMAMLWGWTGIAYHWAYFAPINPAARLFAVGFVVQAVLFLWHGAARSSLAFGPPREHAEVAAGLFLIAYAAVLYPWFSTLSGHRWPAAPMFGVTPCPLTIFTFGMLLLARGQAPRTLLILPVVWSVIGGSAAVLLGVLPDWMLPVSAVAALVLQILRRRGSTSCVTPVAP